MGLFFTLLFVLTAYLGPTTLFGDLAEYHVELIIAVLALITSVPSMQNSGLFRLPQSFALIGMSLTVFFSFVFNQLGSLAAGAMFDFLPNAFTFFLVVLNCKKKRHVEMVIAVMLAATLFTIFRGYRALQLGNVASSYLLSQINDQGQYIMRIRGLSFISDPNDLAQLIVSLIPLLFFFWSKGSGFKNTLLLLVSAALLFGMFLTHSRGAIVAFLAVVIVAARRKIGTIPAGIIAGLLFIGITALNWSGGRGISAEAGSDRMAAWGTGLMLIRSHPIFGVGFGRFTEYNELTAHNTIVVCGAELGLTGLFFWVLFTLPTVRGVLFTGYTPKKQADDSEAARDEVLQPVAPGMMASAEPVPMPDRSSAGPRYQEAVAAPPYFMTEDEQETLPEEEIRRLAVAMVVCFTGYFVASWFLSRSYVMTLFIYGGIAHVIYRAALRSGLAPPPLPVARLLRLTALTSIGLILLVYVIVRVH